MDMTASRLIDRSWEGSRVVGHRGAAAYRPENTLEAFREGIASGADAIECDVHLSLDGELMVIHDPTLDRTTTLTGEVARTESSVMRAVGVPTLTEYLETVKGKAIAVVELKAGAGVARKSMESIRRMGMVESTIVFSFDLALLRETSVIEPEIATVWLVGAPTSIEEARDTLRSAGARGIGVDYPHVGKDVVKAMHEDGAPVFAWTVPPGPEVDRLKELGVNFIITNHPRDVLAQLAK